MKSLAVLAMERYGIEDSFRYKVEAELAGLGKEDFGGKVSLFKRIRRAFFGGEKVDEMIERSFERLCFLAKDGDQTLVDELLHEVGFLSVPEVLAFYERELLVRLERMNVPMKVRMIQTDASRAIMRAAHGK